VTFVFFAYVPPVPPLAARAVFVGEPPPPPPPPMHSMVLLALFQSPGTAHDVPDVRNIVVKAPQMQKRRR
jgi:hypothetical protein